jgi:excisionase family DNA binding protein
MGEQQYLTRVEAAAVLRTCDQTIDKRIKDGQLTAVRVGRRVLIPRQSLESYLAKCRAEAASAGTRWAGGHGQNGGTHERDNEVRGRG